jgi:hypothetical protein
VIHKNANVRVLNFCHVSILTLMKLKGVYPQDDFSLLTTSVCVTTRNISRLSAQVVWKVIFKHFLLGLSSATLGPSLLHMGLWGSLI